jgi:hypothetical protein
MRHHAQHVAFAIADAGDICDRTVGICGGVFAAVWSCVTENNLIVALERVESCGIAEIISVIVRDRGLQNLTALRCAGERRVGGFNANVNGQAAETQAGVANHGARKKSGFEKDLKSVADSEDDPASACEFFYAAHDGRKTRDGSGAEIVTVRKSTGKNYGVGAGEISGLMPDEFGLLAENVMRDVESVIITIGAGENDNTEFHALLRAEVNADITAEKGSGECDKSEL